MRNTLYKNLETALDQLQIGDIILFHTKKIWHSKRIRQLTGSYWNHVALVFDTIRINGNEKEIIIVEAGVTGIEIHRLSKYIKSGIEEIGFKRIPDLTEQEKIRFIGFFLDAIDTPYNYRRMFPYLLRPFIKRYFGDKAQKTFQRWSVDFDSYICSSFTQRCFYLASEPEKRKKRLFINQKNLNLYECMEEVTPGAIGKSKSAIWLYNPHA